MEELEKVIKEIKKFMSESEEEFVSKRKLDERKLSQAAGNMQA
jgi:hypothetical protein